MRRLARYAAVTLVASLVLVGCAGPKSSGTDPEQRRANLPGAAAKAVPAPAKAASVTVFAGSASKPGLDALCKLYEQKTGTKVEVTYGGSGSVLTQFVKEQYGDLYIPGSDDFMDRAEKQDAVLKDTRTVLVYLVPAICVPKGNPKGVKALEDFTKPGLRVVVGDTKSVCLGAIAEELFTKVGNWSQVQKRVASYASSCENVTQTLLLGESDAVIGWDVSAKQNPDKIEAVAIPKELNRERNIPAATIKWSKQPEAAKAFVQFLVTDEAKKVWAEHGYAVEPGGEDASKSVGSQ
jgi:molybdate transport system substrate-binding protein